MNTKADMPITDEQIAEIVREFNRNAPCMHHNRSPIGFGGYHHCDDCGLDVPTEMLDMAELASTKHDELSAVLSALISRLRDTEMDAARWRYARDILTVEAIEAAQSEFINFGLPAAESESLRIDAAIDTAMKGEQ